MNRTHTTLVGGERVEPSAMLLIWQQNMARLWYTNHLPSTDDLQETTSIFSYQAYASRQGYPFPLETLKENIHPPGK